MIFVGDIALPFKDSMTLVNIPDNLRRKLWFGNLEGGIIESEFDIKTRKEVFNDLDALRQLISYLPFAGFALANNHILDIGSFYRTVESLNELKISYCGVGKNLEEASLPILINDFGSNVAVLNFGWEVIQCKAAKINRPGVNPLKRDHVLRTFREMKKEYPNLEMILFMHWSYELECEIQPFERELAKRLIEEGAAAVIGNHPHRVGGFEVYNGRPIIYSLGNWMFLQNYYRGGRLKFPSFCDLELAFEMNFKSGELFFHFFRYDRKNSSLTYLRSEQIQSETLRNISPEAGMSNSDYKNWYKKKHYHKFKGLPIYYWEDSDFMIWIKNGINKVRDLLIKYLR